MNDQIINGPETFAAHGLRFVIGTNVVIVQRDTKAFTRSEKTRRLTILLTALIVTVCLYSIPARQSGGGDAVLNALSLVWPAIPLLWALIAMFPPSGDLRCTPKELQITRRFLGRTKPKVYAALDIRRIQFVEQQFPWPSCIGLFAAGRRLKCVPGIDRAQAQVVLNGLQRFGFGIAASPESRGSSRGTAARRVKNL
jgi:hypothetical protein